MSEFFWLDTFWPSAGVWSPSSNIISWKGWAKKTKFQNSAFECFSLLKFNKIYLITFFFIILPTKIVCFRLRAPKTLHNCQYQIIMAAFRMHFLLKNIKSHKIFIIVIVQSENSVLFAEPLSALGCSCMCRFIALQSPNRYFIFVVGYVAKITRHIVKFYRVFALLNNAYRQL